MLSCRTVSQQWLSFLLPARRYAYSGSLRQRLVRLPVTASIVSKRKELASWFLHHLIASWFHILARYNSSKNSQGVTPSDGDLWHCGGFERAIFAIFRPYFQNGARYDQGYYWTLIRYRISAFDWYQNQRPWMTLNWPWTAIMRIFQYTYVFRCQPQKYEWK